ncbi:OCIA domain-containing protein 1 [Eumeta japonica]|uniref:OCIA domain-containing protein 1 n=1 Tax=Eumeta variegata TaxID=151549 RepID=A0A4C2AEU5_EUMVA|nr:OCIA domain-containing protein 1 [Eumeta japonica]
MSELNDQNLFGVPGGNTPPTEPARSNPARGYKFSPEELQVLKECNRESFYQRSVPIGTALGVSAYYCVQNGFLKPNPRFGAIPKVTMAVILGYFIGKMSYQRKCAEKLMALPGSYIGQLLRDSKAAKYNPSTNPAPPSMFGAGINDIYSDAGPGNSLNLDTDRPSYLNDSDTYHPDETIRSSDSELSGPPPLTYEELRRKNRSDYSSTRQDPYKIEPSFAPQPRAQPHAQPAPPQKPSTNKYGDDME